MTICRANGCTREAVSRGLCLMHYKRNQKHGDPNYQYQPSRRPMLKRFYAKVEIPSLFDCWIWAGARDPQGYGKIYVGKGVSPAMSAHRVSWQLHCGAIPAGVAVLHRCDNPSCVNPAHLFLGTLADNVADMDRKGRRRWKSTYGPRPPHWKIRRGEQHPMAKLTATQVALIRNRLAAGEIGKSIAADFAVTPHVISRIKTGRGWRSV